MSDHGRLVMDMLWPILGGDHTDADTWHEIDAALTTYGDERYQAAIADVVEWLEKENGLCDCSARSAGECGCGAWDDYKQWPLERTVDEITRRFGKGHDHG